MTWTNKYIALGVAIMVLLSGASFWLGSSLSSKQGSVVGREGSLCARAFGLEATDQYELERVDTIPRRFIDDDFLNELVQFGVIEEADISSVPWGLFNEYAFAKDGEVISLDLRDKVESFAVDSLEGFDATTATLGGENIRYLDLDRSTILLDTDYGPDGPGIASVCIVLSTGEVVEARLDWEGPVDVVSLLDFTDRDLLVPEKDYVENGVLYLAISTLDNIDLDNIEKSFLGNTRGTLHQSVIANTDSDENLIWISGGLLSVGSNVLVLVTDENLYRFDIER